MQAGLQTDVCVLDFAKAFDKVSHLHLMHKLHWYVLRPSPPLRWWSLSLLSYVRVILVIGSGTRASLFTFITYITQYTSHGSRRHISSQDLFRDPPATQMLHNFPHSLINQFPLLASANHRCRASCTSTCSAHLPVLGLYGFLRPTLFGAVNHWHRPSPCICDYVTLTSISSMSTKESVFVLPI